MIPFEAIQIITVIVVVAVKPLGRFKIERIGSILCEPTGFRVRPSVSIGVNSTVSIVGRRPYNIIAIVIDIDKAVFIRVSVRFVDRWSDVVIEAVVAP